jgi:flagellar protein FliT
MDEQEHILDIYGSLATVTGQMVDAAKRSDWDRLISLEHDCRSLIESLKRSDAGAKTGAAYAQRKIALIRKVLADDAEVRKFTEPWMTRLEAYLGGARQERKLQRTYEADLGG